MTAGFLHNPKLVLHKPMRQPQLLRIENHMELMGAKPPKGKIYTKRFLWFGLRKKKKKTAIMDGKKYII
jgi:hypothetical protein